MNILKTMESHTSKEGIIGYVNSISTKPKEEGLAKPMPGVRTGYPSSTGQVPGEQRGPRAFQVSPLQSIHQLRALMV